MGAKTQWLDMLSFIPSSVLSLRGGGHDMPCALDPFTSSSQHPELGQCPVSRGVLLVSHCWDGAGSGGDVTAFWCLKLCRPGAGEGGLENKGLCGHLESKATWWGLVLGVSAS